MKKAIITIFVLCISQLCVAQENDYVKDFHSFRSEILKDYEDFRSKALADYMEFVKKAWADYQSLSPIPRPKRERMDPPVPYNDNPVQNEPINNVPIEEEPVIITPPEPEPQPDPILDDYKKGKSSPIPTISYEDIVFEYMGTPFTVSVIKGVKPTLSSLDGNGIADFFSQLTSKKNDRTMVECLSLREEHNLCDWAYLNLLKSFSDKYLGKGNESTLMTAYLFMASGYTMRIAISNGIVHLLYASKHTIYNRQYYVVDDEKFYSLDECPNNARICSASFPGEKGMSLYINHEPGLKYSQSQERNLKSELCNSFSFGVTSNINLIDFYNTYPSSEVDNDFGTRWAMYANTPLSALVKNKLYTPMKEKLSGLSQYDAVTLILNWVQTAFEYEYDEKVWGGDRAFFPDETIYYPYCDCEDRSILFSRIVRDLLGMDVVLIYYPGHLAAAVNFSDKVDGDYFMLDGRKYTICDPTYIGAPIGMTMPKFKETRIKVIRLVNRRS